MRFQRRGILGNEPCAPQPTTPASFFFRLFPDRLDFRGDAMNVSYRTLRDIGVIRDGYASRPSPSWFN